MAYYAFKSHKLFILTGCNVGGMDQMVHGASHLKHYDQKVVSSLHDAVPSNPASLMGGASLSTNKVISCLVALLV